MNCQMIAAPESYGFVPAVCFAYVEAQTYWNDHWGVTVAYIHTADLVDLILLFLIYMNFSCEVVVLNPNLYK